MEDQIFGFNLPKSEPWLKPMCSACGGQTVEVYSTTYPTGPTGIYRCLEDACDWYTDPTFGEIYR